MAVRLAARTTLGSAKSNYDGHVEMKVFLTGATGYIGTAVLQSLTRGGHEVTALVRDSAKGARVAELGARAVVGNLDDSESYALAAEGHEAYVLTAFDWLGPRTRHRPTLARDASRDRGIRPVAGGRDLHLGRVGARQHVATRGRGRRAGSGAERDLAARARAPRPGCHTSRCAGRRGPTGIVYGESRGIVADMLRDASNGLIRVVGDGRNHWPLIYARDLGELYRLLLEQPDAAGLYHANDEGDETVLELVEAMCDHVNQRPEVRHMPVEEAVTKMGGYAAALAMEQIVRSPRARALGWNPTMRSVAGNVSRLFEEWRADREA